jgi:hypothetical protein
VLSTLPITMFLMDSANGTVLKYYKDKANYSGSNTNLFLSSSLHLRYISSNEWLVLISMTSHDLKWNAYIF